MKASYLTKEQIFVYTIRISGGRMEDTKPLKRKVASGHISVRSQPHHTLV